MNRAQARAFAVGTKSALGRKKDNQTLTYSLECSADFSESQITEALKHALFVRGNLNPATTRLDVVHGLNDIRTILTEKDEALTFERQRSQQMADELERLRKQIAQRSPSDTREWITLTALAKRLHVHYTTLWRAKEAGRLTVKITGGTKKDQMLCDPTTYVPVIRRLGKKDI